MAIVTPNHHHLPAARAALEAGIPVLSDKPATATLDEGRELARLVAETGLPYGLTHTYSGYPLVREARARTAAGALGTVRKLVVEYPQGWLAGETGGKQAEWRVDPARSGEGGCIGDIGTHAFQLAEFVTGLKVTELLADLAAVVPGRALDDDCSVLLRFDNGARGVLLASQIEVGELNGLRIRIYGDRGGLAWKQEEPNLLTIHTINGRTELVRAGDASLGPDSRAATRTPGGHPEGYLEAFANLYRDFARLLRGRRLSGLGQPAGPLPLARRRADRLRRDLLEDGTVRLPRLGGARMGMRAQASRRRRGGRGEVHGRPLIRVTEHSFDDFAMAGSDRSLNRQLMGIG